LVDINGKPLLGYWLDLLFRGGIERVLINTHYLPLMVEKYVRDSAWSSLIDITHEVELLGTGGTILKNKQYFNGDPFLVAHADNLTIFNINKFIKKYYEYSNKADILMMTFDTDRPESCGIVKVDDDGIVNNFYEKVIHPPGNRANGAVYIFKGSVINSIEAINNNAVDISNQIIPKYLGRIATYHNSKYHRDIGDPESLKMARMEFSNKYDKYSCLSQKIKKDIQ
jgi:mannose-1-phosphate guanylyltransferase